MAQKTLDDRIKKLAERGASLMQAGVAMVIAVPLIIYLIEGMQMGAGAGLMALFGVVQFIIGLVITRHIAPILKVLAERSPGLPNCSSDAGGEA